MSRRAWNSTLPAPEKAMKRTTRLRAKITSKRFATRRDPKYCGWIRTLPCAVYLPVGVEGMKACSGPVECAHVRSRGAGGDDRGNVTPLCRRHHREQHDRGMESFQYWYGVDLASVAATLALKYDELAA